MPFEFARLLVLHRKSRGLTQVQISVEVNATASLISKFERGTRFPDRPKVLGLARALHLSQIETDDLLVAAGYAPLRLGYLELDNKLKEFTSRIDKLERTIDAIDEKLTRLLNRHI